MSFFKKKKKPIEESVADVTEESSESVEGTIEETVADAPTDTQEPTTDVQEVSEDVQPIETPSTAVADVKEPPVVQDGIVIDVADAVEKAEKKVNSLFKAKKQKTSKKKKSKKETPYDPDTLSARWERYQQIRKHNHVILKTLTRDPRTGEYDLDITLIHRSSLPKDAVEVTGERNTYALDKIKDSEWYARVHQNELFKYPSDRFTASDAALYMTSNKMDNALAVSWTQMNHVDKKKFIIIAVIVICSGALVFMVM